MMKNRGFWQEKTIGSDKKAGEIHRHMFLHADQIHRLVYFSPNIIHPVVF